MSTTVRGRVTGTATVGVLSLEVVDCAGCGVIFALTAEYAARRVEDGKRFYCPNGHLCAYAETEADRQRKRADTAERQRDRARISRDAARDQAQAAERSARAYRGHLTRMRNYIAKGVCPVPGCRRTFANVRAHITGQHPQWCQEHPEVVVP